jgi:hypothetical protein
VGFTVPSVPPGNLKYARPSDIITSTFTWSAAAGTISTDPLYGLSALYDGKMARPLKFTDSPVVAVRVVGDAGSARRVDGMALPNSNIPAGTVMKAQMGSDPTFATFAVSVDVTMGAYGLDGHSASPWADFVSASGYTTGGYRYVSWYVPVTSNVQWLGELLVFSNLRQFSVWPQFGNRGASHPFLENLYTEYGVRRVIKRLIKQRRVVYPFKGTDADFDDLQALVEDSGGVAEPFFLVANSNVNTDGGLYGRLTPDTAQMVDGSEEWFDLTNFTIAFEEDSRSLPL